MMASGELFKLPLTNQGKGYPPRSGRSRSCLSLSGGGPLSLISLSLMSLSLPSLWLISLPSLPGPLADHLELESLFSSVSKACWTFPLFCLSAVDACSVVKPISTILATPESDWTCYGDNELINYITSNNGLFRYNYHWTIGHYFSAYLCTSWTKFLFFSILFGL